MIRVVTRVSIPYATIAAQVLALFERRPYAIDAGFVRGQVHVRDVVARPEGARLAVDATLEAELARPLPHVHGVLHVSATPVYDATTQSVRLSGASVTFDVDHVLVRAALAFRRRALVDALDGFSLDLEPVLGALRDRSNERLSGPTFGSKVAWRGRVETLRVEGLHLEEELIVVASASGQLRAILDPAIEDAARD